MKPISRLVAAGLLAAAAAVPAWAEPPTADMLKKIAGAGAIRLGARESSAPLSYTTGNGQYVGYHVDVCGKIAEAIRAALKMPNLPIEYTLVTSTSRVPLVQNGNVDLECGSTTNNAARAQQVAFAPTTYVTNVRMAVKADSGIASIGQLAGRTVVTTQGTTSVTVLRRHERANGVDFKELTAPDHASAFLLLESGRAEAFVMDDNILAGNIVNSKNPAAYKIVGETLSEEPIAIMLAKDDPAFRKLVDDAVKGLMKSGELEKIYAKWFTSPIPPRGANVAIPMSAALKNAIAHPNADPAESYAKK